jgi:hypothetical protein
MRHLLILSLILLTSACIGTPDEDNLSPEVDAGLTQNIILGDSLTLTATASDEDGEIEEISWSKVSGGPVTMANTNNLQVQLSAFEPGKYVFQVTVIDDMGASISDTVTVYVQDKIIKLLT